MFRLNRREQALVAFVLLSFVLGLGVKAWRENRAVGVPSADVR